MSIVSTYVNAVQKFGTPVVPFEEMEEALTGAGRTTAEDILGYSAIVCNATGKLVKRLPKDRTATLFFMPHVVARGDVTQEAAAMMKQAGFKHQGLCQGRPELEARQEEAQRLLDLMVKAGGFPGTDAPVEHIEVEEVAEVLTEQAEV